MKKSALSLCVALAWGATAGLASAVSDAGGTDMTPAVARSDDPMAGVSRIVFCGNSLTDGSAWCDWVVETLQANGRPNLTMFNAGVAGNDTAKLRARYEKDVLGVKPDLVVVNIGTLDNKPPEDYRRDFGALVEATRASGAKMVLMTPAPIRGTNNPTYRSPQYAPVVRELAERHDCLVVDTQAVFDRGLAAGKEMWGPDGIHHTIDAWRGMARAVLDALGCRAPLVERTSLYPNAITDWLIGPAVPWKNTAPVRLPNMPEDYDPIAAGKGAYPPLPESFDGWRRYDREREIEETSWWQKCWLERGGVMPLGQHVNKDKPGVPSQTAGAYALAVVNSPEARKTTLHVGGAPPYAVWLNGTMVWNGHLLHGYHPSQDRIQVTLKKGENHIMVFSNWLFYVSLGVI